MEIQLRRFNARLVASGALCFAVVFYLKIANDA
jgi:hypothetical protein